MLTDFKELNQRIAEIVERDKINDDFKLNDSSLDSLDMLTLLSILDEIFSINLDSDEIYNSKTVLGLKKLLKNKTN